MSWSDVMVPNYGTPSLTIQKAEGTMLWDDQGNAYLDLLSGIAVNALGHQHPKIVAAVQQQMGQFSHLSNLYQHEPGVALATKLRELLGGQHKALFVNSGTEANEAALKLVRRHAAASGRPNGVILAFEQGFHGRTSGALALTGQPAYQAGFHPLPTQILHIPFNDAKALQAAFQAHEIVGVFTECIQGEGGVLPMEPAFAALFQTLVQEHQALLVVDEVQTGMGRTGTWFAFEQFGLDPDVVTLSKALGAGLPLGACMVRDGYADLLGPGTHGCTFGGNPVSCAAALAQIEVFEEDALLQRVQDLGRVIQNWSQDQEIHARGRGLLWGIPVPDAKSLQANLQSQGFLTGIAGPAVLRLAPPFVMAEHELLGALDAVSKALVATA